MNVSTAYVRELKFPKGATVHYGHGEWLSICGHAWIHQSNDPDSITCIGCIEALSELAKALMSVQPQEALL